MVLATLGAFLPALRGEFLNWDDDTNFLENPNWRGLGPDPLKWMFTDFSGHYMPVTWLTLGLDYVVWGMKPFGYHLTSLLFHAANALLFYFCLLRLLRRGLPGADPARLDWAAAAGALVFSIHPLRVESVAWITERRDVTSLFFLLLSLLAYLRRTDEQVKTPAPRKWLALSVAAFAASLFSKATGFTLPLVLLLLDVWPLRRWAPGRTAALLLEKIPFAAIMLLSVAVTLLAQSRVGAIYSAESYPLARSFTMPGYRISFYLAKTLLPIRLAPLYSYTPGFGLREILGWAVVAGITTLVLLRRASAPAAAVAWLSFGVLIAPVSGLVQGGMLFSAADRYTYLPCLPLAALAAAALAAAPPRIPGRALAAVGGVVLLTLSVLTWTQTRVWKDSFSLWDYALRLDSTQYLPYNNRGTARFDRGDVAGAIRDYEASMAIRPDWEKPWNNRGIARATVGDHAGAVQDFTRSLQIDPGQTNPYGYRALSRLKIGDYRGALTDLDEALRRRPEPLYFLKRAGIRGMQGNLDGSIADSSAALEMRPDLLEAWAGRGMARLQRGDAGGAADLQRALEIAPPGWPQRGAIENALRSLRPR